MADSSPAAAQLAATTAGHAIESPHKSFLTQKFGKVDLGQHSVVGYSVAGEETVVQIPELGVCFDIGRAPQFALSSDIVCISHGHMDHLAGIAYYLSQRYFQGMNAGTVLLPAELEGPVDDLLRAWQRVERQNTPYTLVPMTDGQYHKVRNDFGIRAMKVHHGGHALGYSLIDVRRKLRPEFHDKTGEELVALKKDGVEIQYTLEVPLVTYLGDTGPGPVFEHPDVVNAGTLITECTFYEKTHHGKSRAGRHLHLAQFAEIVPTLKNKHLVVLHVSRRTGVRRAKRLLAKALGGTLPANLHFLMDLKDAKSAGDAALSEVDDGKRG